VRVSVTSVAAILAQNQTGSRFFILFFVLVQLELATSMKI
jgi:hypothetical protein